MTLTTPKRAVLTIKKKAPAKPKQAYKTTSPSANKTAPKPNIHNTTIQAAQSSVQTDVGKPIFSAFKLTALGLPSDGLAFNLLTAASAVNAVLDGVALPQAIAHIVEQEQLSSANRGAMQDLSYRTMRQVGRVDALISAMTTKAPTPPLLYSLLCCALALIVEEDSALHPYAEFTVVDQAVNAAAAHPDIAHAKNMVNALLRRFLRERSALLKEVLTQPAALWNYPNWWINSLQSAYPKDWQAILKAGNTLPPLTLRINQRKTSVQDYVALLTEQQIEAEVIGEVAIRLQKPLPVQQIPGFLEGLVSVQDAAAQLAVPLLDIQNGMRILDACAAPGGKTGHILETVKADVIALDVDPKRLIKITQNCERLGLSAQLITGDASSKEWWDGKLFDRIIADVPCTASGIVRRHPDIRWLRRKGDAGQLATLSARILDNLWSMLKPDGKLLLVTCSIWPQESEAQAAAFAHRQGAIRLPAAGQLLPCVNGDNNSDGLFYALFQKKP